MSIHSLVSLSDKHHYVNVVNHAIKYFQRTLSPSAFKLWFALYEASYFRDGIFKATYQYLSDITNLSVSTIVRACKKLISLDLCQKIHNQAEDGHILENTYVLTIPDSLLNILKSAPLRIKPEIELLPDYSVDIDRYENESDIYSNEDHIPDVGKMVAGDSRGLLDVNAKPVGGSIGATLGRIKDKMREIFEEGGGTSQNEHTLITILNPDNNTILETEPKKAITACRQEEEITKIPKSVPKAMVNKIEKIVKTIPGISNPSGLVREAIHFVTTQRKFDNPWAAVGAFRKLLGKSGDGPWRTPFGMRYEK